MVQRITSQKKKPYIRATSADVPQTTNAFANGVRKSSQKVASSFHHPHSVTQRSSKNNRIEKLADRTTS